MRDYYESDYSDDPIFYDDDEFSFSDIPDSDWNLCGNCHNYLNGHCLLDKHEVEPDESCSYNLKKEKKND